VSHHVSHRVHRDAAAVPFLERSRVMVSPVFNGAGIPNKVLEGTAAARPVVTSRHVAARSAPPKESGYAGRLRIGSTRRLSSSKVLGWRLKLRRLQQGG
jgi:Glycosyl transferases group 1